MANKKDRKNTTTNVTNVTESEFLHGENMNPDDFDMQNKDNSMTHVDKPKKSQ